MDYILRFILFYLGTLIEHFSLMFIHLWEKCLLEELDMLLAIMEHFHLKNQGIFIWTITTLA